MRSFANLRLVALAFVSNLVLCGTSFGDDQANPANNKPVVSEPHPPATAPKPEERKAWNARMLKVPAPKNGCFTAAYPDTEWREVECGRPSPYRNLVGDGTDYVAQTSGNYISSSTGTFATPPSTAASETGQFLGSGPQVANLFTLQMNSQSPVNSSDGSIFNTPACGGVLNCSGWQQFVFSQSQGPAPKPGQMSAEPGTTPGLFVEYWLYNAGPTCPALPSWALNGQPPGTPWPGGGGTCVFNGPMTYVPPLTSADLPGIVMKATAGANDTVTLITTSGMYLYSEPSVLSLSNAWTETEFNVVGDCCRSEANFDSPTTLVVNLQIADGFPTAPTCIPNDGTTGETNSLTLSGTPTVIPVESEPSIEFTETNVSPTPASCSHSVGDTHLETLDGLFYDFQAAGDFVLAQADPDFVVQTRQVSGAPSWPNADVNHGVATQMGKTRVAICVLPTRVFVDGKPTDLGDGKVLSLPDGVKVYRGGSTYAVMREGGDIVHAQINNNTANTWIDVTVGVGESARRNARGLLANPHGNVGELAARTGAVFAAPVSFADLYHPYADSWRVASKETLLSPCGENVETGAASKPFYANDLEQQLADRTRAICTAAGVKEGPELDACTLDTAVLGGAEAAKVFVRTLPIRAVLRPNLALKRIEIKRIIRP
jgi:hypothetical protein